MSETAQLQAGQEVTPADTPDTPETFYRKAMARKNADVYIVQCEFRMNNYLDAARWFEMAGDYLDAPGQAAECREKAKRAAADWKKSDYEKAVRQMDEAAGADDYQKAAKAFRALGDYEEARIKCAACEDQVRRLTRKSKARRNIWLLVIALIIALIISGFPTGFWKYALAWGYMQAGAYSNAQTAFSQTDFSNAKEMARRNEFLCLQEAEAGDTVTFGAFRWKVLVRSGEEVLLILNDMTSASGLSAIAYHEQQAEVSWESSTLRAWLNDAFLDNMDSEERAQMVAQECAPGTNPEYGTEYTETTTEYVTILSAEEALQYADLLSYYTAPFWLRSPGHAADTACLYTSGSGVQYYGDAVSDDTIMCRPLIRVKTDYS